jgi:hypothetical protein
MSTIQIPSGVKRSNSSSMHRYLNILAALVTGFGLLLGYGGASGAQENPVTAIDIALEPDATMIQHAEAANALLRQVFPTGYALDATHRPHIPNGGPRQSLRRSRRCSGRGEAGRMDARGVQI